MNKPFLRWIKNVHPEIIEEYKDMLKRAMEELEDLCKKVEK